MGNNAGYNDIIVPRPLSGTEPFLKPTDSGGEAAFFRAEEMGCGWKS